MSRANAVSSSLSGGRSRLGLASLPLGLGRGHAEHLAGVEWSPGFARAPSTRSCPVRAHMRDGGEAGVGQMPLEPAVEPDAVVVGRDGEAADVAHATVLTRYSPANSASTDPITDTSA